MGYGYTVVSGLPPGGDSYTVRRQAAIRWVQLHCNQAGRYQMGYSYTVDRWAATSGWAQLRCRQVGCLQVGYGYTVVSGLPPGGIRLHYRQAGGHQVGYRFTVIRRAANRCDIATLYSRQRAATSSGGAIVEGGLPPGRIQLHCSQAGCLPVAYSNIVDMRAASR